MREEIKTQTDFGERQKRKDTYCREYICIYKYNT